MSHILGIDPGQQGAFVSTINGIPKHFKFMPLTKEKDIDWTALIEVLKNFSDIDTPKVFLERAMPMAMGSKHAFNYGRGFAAIEIALKVLKFSVTYVEANKWGKIMHEGISGDLKPKAKSRIAFERLYPNNLDFVPKTKNGNYHEGVLEALLIAGYGGRQCP